MPSTEAVSTIGRYQAGEAVTCAVFGEEPDAVAGLVDMRQIDLTNRDCAFSRERVPKKARKDSPIEACIGVVKRQADQRAAALACLKSLRRYFDEGVVLDLLNLLIDQG